MIGNHFEEIRSDKNIPKIAFKKSPVKYQFYESTTQQPPKQNDFQNENSHHWGQPKYHTLKKIPDEYANLRQTFDLRTNARIQSKIANYDLDNNNNQMQKPEPVLRQTFNIKKSPLMFQEKDLSLSGNHQKGWDTQEKKTPSEKKLARFVSEKQIGLDTKFKDYKSTLERFKDQVQINCKMTEELKKLKEDRRKRHEARQKQMNSISTLKEEDKLQKKLFTYTPQYRKEEKEPSEKLISSLEIQNKGSYSGKRYEKNHHKVENYSESTLNSYKHNDYRSGNSKESLNHKIGGKISLGDFALGKTLGEGKFGVVYQAIHKASGMLFALKKVPKEMIKSHLMVDQFILELKLQTFLSHSNILTIYAHFDDIKHIYLVLEYMEEGTLFSHLKKNKKLGEKEVATKMRQVATAIKYLHENCIAHRDIKPENVVMSNGICKLCDFGWATICEDRRKTYCGTFDYAPPEILEGAEYDFSVDLWCLGVLTFQLLVGKAPFYHISRKQTMKRIINVQNTHIEYPKTMSAMAISFIDNLLKKDPSERLTAEATLEHPFLKAVQKKH